MTELRELADPDGDSASSAADPASRRAESIARYGILEGPPARQLSAIVELAAMVCRTSKATINIITDTEQVQVATYGFEAGSVCSIDESMCARRFEEISDQPVVVPDARRDPRYADNPFVDGRLGEVRFYASCALQAPGEPAIGTLCVLDEVPSDLDDAQVAALGTLAERVVDVLELGLRSQELAASNERLAGFAGRLSHDLKSPLASIGLSLGMIRERLADSEQVPEDVSWLLERAIRGSDRMAAFIDDVLAFASLGDLARAPVDLADLLDDVLVDLDGRLRDVEVERGPLAVVHGDRVQLGSLLQNLLDNAVKYRHPDRSPRVRVAARTEPGGEVRVEVTDNGLGIPVEHRQRVFGRLVRLSDDDRGSGIGLDTCRRIVQAHGGTIGIDSADWGGGPDPAAGTTVWFCLPG